MLVAMAYNVGLFLAIVVGEGLGFLIFSSGLVLSPPQVDSDPKCH
jgi:hypothetical protein